MAESSERKRDARRSREAILAAAEDHFARNGFEMTSLHQIAESAGVARSTPAYFFGSKETLYDAVLARVVARGRQAMTSAPLGAGASAEDVVGAYVDTFLHFLAADLNFVRLIQREALGDASRVADFFGPWVEEALAAVRPAAEQAKISPERLVLDLAALCWYPFAHEHTVLPALGMKARDPDFLDEQKAHLRELVRALTQRRRTPS